MKPGPRDRPSLRRCRSTGRRSWKELPSRSPSAGVTVSSPFARDHVAAVPFDGDRLDGEPVEVEVEAGEILRGPGRGLWPRRGARPWPGCTDVQLVVTERRTRRYRPAGSTDRRSRSSRRRTAGFRSAGAAAHTAIIMSMPRRGEIRASRMSESFRVALAGDYRPLLCGVNGADFQLPWRAVREAVPSPTLPAWWLDEALHYERSRARVPAADGRPRRRCRDRGRRVHRALDGARASGA